MSKIKYDSAYHHPVENRELTIREKYRFRTGSRKPINLAQVERDENNRRHAERLAATAERLPAWIERSNAKVRSHMDRARKRWGVEYR